MSESQKPRDPVEDAEIERIKNLDQDYRRLLDEHRMYEDRLRELLSRPHLDEEERKEEASLKKKKLLLKDQMELLLALYKASDTSH